MNILLLGGGGREHALAWKLSRSKRCTQLFIAPGNAGTAAHGINVPIKPLDFEAVHQFVVDQDVQMVVVGPEAPLVNGIWDYFQSMPELRHRMLIGPSKAGAMLEGSKSWAKAFMQRSGIPTAAFKSFTRDQLEEGLAYLTAQNLPIVLKADGLAEGKGVVICETYSEAEVELRAMLAGKFGAAGEEVVIEQFLSGVEFSVFVLTDGRTYKLLPEAKDYKRIGEGDTGPNTGGMGALSPVPFFDAAMLQKVESRIIQPTIAGLQRENLPYTGFIFFGLINVNGDPYVIEYNCRMGDPETEVVMPRLRNDLVSVLQACHSGRLARVKPAFSALHASTVMLVSGGYPGEYEKGKVIHGLNRLSAAVAFHAGTVEVNGEVLTNGGRVIAVTAMGKNLKTALKRAYRNVNRIQFENSYFRADIGRDVG